MVERTIGIDHKSDRLSLKCILRQYWLVLVAPLLLLGPMLFLGQALFWGTPSLQFVPWWSYAVDSLRQGVLPLWNPLNGFGAPLIANYQVAFFYPPNWLLLLMAAVAGPGNQAAAIAWGYTFLSLLHLAWAGLGMALLLHRLGFLWLGQVIGGIAFALSGFVVARLGFFSMVWVAAWLPWVIFFADAIASPVSNELHPRVARFRLLPWLTLCIGMQLLAGHAQLTWYSMLLAFAWVTAGSVRSMSVRAVMLNWLSLGAAALLAAGLAAVQLIPTFEYLRQSQRADAFAYEEALTYSFWPWRMITLFSPDFFGSPASGDFWGYASYWEDHLYIGLLPVLLAVATLWLLLKGFRRAGRSRWWNLILLGWVGIIVAFMLALGRYTPVFPFLYKYVPTFDMFQAPARYLIWVTFALPLLAAVGIEHWRCPTGRGLYWFRLGTAGAFAVTLGAGLAWGMLDNIRLTFIRATALTGMWALGFGLLTLAIPLAEKYQRRGLWQWTVIGWTVLDLLAVGWGLNPSVPLDFYAGRAAAAEQIQAAASGQRVYLGRDDEYDLKFKRFMRFKDFNPLEDWRTMRIAMLPNLNLLDGIPSVNNFDPLVPGRYARWMAALRTLDPVNQQTWLAWMGIGVVERIDVSRATGVRFDSIPGAQRWHWYSCAQSYNDPEEVWVSIENRLDATEEGWREPLLLEGAGEVAEGACPGGSAVQETAIQLESEKPDRITLTVSAPQAGWLLVADAWYPGWQAQIDGESAQVYPANFLFRAVQVPAGKHQVTMIYRPFGFYFGALFSILVLLFIIFRLNQWGRISV